jgi:VWFA-related protein
MSRLVGMLAIPVFLSVSTAFAQTTAQPTADSPPVSSIHVQSRLVVVDVMVRDKDRKPVHGLTAADFVLRESGNPQQIKVFEEHRSQPGRPIPPNPKLPQGTFTNFIPVQPDAASTVILLDALNTPTSDQAYVRSQLIAYLKKADPHARISIFGLTTKLTMLQGFTSDPEVLRQIAAKGLDSKPSPLIDDVIGQGTGPRSPSEILEGVDANNFAMAIAAMKSFEAQTTADQNQIRIQTTITAFNALARYLSVIPGRKNLIWFSGAFPITFLPDAGVGNPMLAVAGLEDDFRNTSILLANGRVAVYPIDARGLETLPEKATTQIFGTVHSANDQVRDTHQGGVGTADKDFLTGNAQEHLTMEAVAHDTGGATFNNNNGLTGAVANIIANGSDFYTISYAPSNTTETPDFRGIEVNLAGDAVNRKLSLSYRRGYYTDRSSSIVAGEKVPPPDSSRLSRRAALSPGAPTPTQILIKVQILPSSKATEDALAPGNSSDRKPPLKGPFRRYTVSIAASPRELKFTSTPKGDVHTSVEFITLCYDADGQLLNAASNTVDETLDYKGLKQVLQTGLGFQQDISVPAAGGHFLRVVVHDLISNRYGAIEIPFSDLRGLQPAAEKQAAAATSPVLSSLPDRN